MTYHQRGMLVALAKLKGHALRTLLAEPEAFNRGVSVAAISAWHGKKFALAEIDKRLVASRIGALRNHVVTLLIFSSTLTQ